MIFLKSGFDSSGVRANICLLCGKELAPGRKRRPNNPGRSKYRGGFAHEVCIQRKKAAKKLVKPKMSLSMTKKWRSRQKEALSK